MATRGKAAVNAPQSRRFALCGDARWSRQRLECGGFSTAFRASSNPNPHLQRTLLLNSFWDGRLGQTEFELLADMKRVAFLFGSGISLPSDVPGACEITDALLNRGWRGWRDDDGEFHFCPNGTESIGIGKCAQDFLRVLKKHIDPHLQLRENRQSNYEDHCRKKAQKAQRIFSFVLFVPLCGQSRRRERFVNRKSKIVNSVRASSRRLLR
jgi:hypothetical protein